MVNARRLKKSAFTAVYVYLVFLICYMPQTCWRIADGGQESAIPNTDAGLYFLTLVYLNSSLNPLIYCWKMREIRHNIINIFRNAFSCNNWRWLQLTLKVLNCETPQTKKSHVENVMELQTSHLGLPHSRKTKFGFWKSGVFAKASQLMALFDSYVQRWRPKTFVQRTSRAS